MQWPPGRCFFAITGLIAESDMANGQSDVWPLEVRLWSSPMTNQIRIRQGRFHPDVHPLAAMCCNQCFHR